MLNYQRATDITYENGDFPYGLLLGLPHYIAHVWQQKHVLNSPRCTQDTSKPIPTLSLYGDIMQLGRCVGDFLKWIPKTIGVNTKMV